MILSVLLNLVTAAAAAAAVAGHCRNTPAKITLRYFTVLSNLFCAAASLAVAAARLCGAVPNGILNVSRMLMSVSIGEEDRVSLANVMRTAVYLGGLVTAAMTPVIILCAVPLTRLYFRDTSSAVYQMTLSGFRIIPLAFVLGLFYLHYVGYGQAAGKKFIVTLLSMLDGVICVAGFTLLTIDSY